MMTWRTEMGMGGAEESVKRVCMFAVAVASLVGVATPRALLGQNIEKSGDGEAGGGRAAPPSLEALRVSGPVPVIDGILDEPDWARAMVASDFIVFEPNEGCRPPRRPKPGCSTATRPSTSASVRTTPRPTPSSRGWQDATNALIRTGWTS